MSQLEFEDYCQLVPKVLEHVEFILAKANREGNIIEYLKRINFPLTEVPDLDEVEEKWKILVIGYGGVSKRDLLGVACSMGFSDDDFDFELIDPDKYDYSKLKNSRRYKYVLVGPMAHNQKGKGRSNSMINEMEENPDYPVVIRLLNKANTLKISMRSFQEALQEVQKIQSAS